MLVQFNPDAVNGFFGDEHNHTIPDVVPGQLLNVRISKPGEATEQEHVPDTFKGGLAFVERHIFQPLDFILFKIDDFL